MQSLKLRVNVRDHRIADELPPEVPDGEAELVIQFEGSAAPDMEHARRHLQLLFDRLRGRSPGRSREDIDRQLAEERAGWGD